MLNKAICFCIFIAVLPRPAFAKEVSFQFAKQIESPPLKQEELLAIALDSEVFRATQDTLGDIRLLDSAQRPVPYLLRKLPTTRPRRIRKTWPAKHFTARPLDGGLEVTVELEKDGPHPNGLTLVSPLHNFEQRVRVEVSADGRQWEPLADETVIFDYARYMDIRNDRVPFPETEKRFFRIIIDDITAEQESELLALSRRLQGDEEAERTEKVIVDRRPFRIERVEFSREVEAAEATGDEKTKYPVTDYRIEEDAAKHQTRIVVDVQRQPLTLLRLKTADRNFSRHAVIEAENVQGVSKTWRRIGEGTLSRIEFKGLKREELAISFPQFRQSHYRVVIDDRDSPPLSISSIEAEGNVYELVYLASPAVTYQLVYGSEDVEAPAYDTAAIEELLRSGFPPTRAEMGEQQPASGAGQPPEFKPSKLINNPLLLGALILLLVVALGWGLFQAAKRTDSLPDE